LVHGELAMDDVYKYDGKYKCKHCRYMQKEASRKICPVKLRVAYLKRHYGITMNDYAVMKQNQNDCCAICNNPETATIRNAKNPNGLIRNLAIDHNHDTKNIRGLLCVRCNSMIGNAKDNPDILRAGADYLEKHGG
jgi:hypothetical protein